MLLNKIFGAILAVLLGLLGLKFFGDIAFGKAHHGGHHGEEEHSINDVRKEKFAYYLEAEDGGHGGEVVEVVFDLGAELASADIEKGEKSFRSKCASCHTIDAGGANGTGPNLHDIAGRPIAGHAGFGYSGAMQDYAAAEGNWGYTQLNDFLNNPKGTVSGTAMAFAGLRKDPERMNVIAYLASVNAAAPAFPAPLPAAGEAAAHGEHDAHASEAGVAVTGDLPEAEQASIIAGEAAAGTEGLLEAAEGAAQDAAGLVDEAVEKAEDAAHDAVEEHGGH